MTQRKINKTYRINLTLYHKHFQSVHVKYGPKKNEDELGENYILRGSVNLVEETKTPLG